MQRRHNLTDLLFLAAYACVLVAVAVSLPLGVPEVQNIAWSADFSWSRFFAWMSNAPDPSPLGYLVQLPFVLLFGASRLGVRLPALIFAVGASFLLLRLAGRAALRWKYVALLLFMLVPAQLLAITAATQYELATFFVLLATLKFFDLIAKPAFQTAILFALTIAACLYTDHHSVLPLFGAILFLLRFAGRPKERKATYFALGACVAGIASYVPYYVWGHAEPNPYWFAEAALSVRSFLTATPVDWALFAGVLLIFAGVIVGAAVSFRLPPSQVICQIILFCLFGSVLVPLLFTLGNLMSPPYAMAPRDLLYMAPAAVILFAAALEWVASLRLLVASPGAIRGVAVGLGIAVLAVCILADAQLVSSPKQNIALESSYVMPELVADSCVVFVSERYSKWLFLVFQPQLEEHECLTFFHHRIVLAVHPYVRPDQASDAESYFRGLDFDVLKRIASGGGEILVLDSQ